MRLVHPSIDQKVGDTLGQRRADPHTGPVSFCIIDEPAHAKTRRFRRRARMQMNVTIPLQPFCFELNVGCEWLPGGNAKLTTASSLPPKGRKQSRQQTEVAAGLIFLS
jgi:hypothetical protein